MMHGDCRELLPTLPDASVHCVVTSPPYFALRSYLDAEHPDKHREMGSEASPDEFIAQMVAVCREVKRVMRPDAVAFVNLGDSYADKQLQMMPARVAIALQQDGWWLRSDIIWAKPNPMPESVTDRPSSSHEHVFLLTKSARYFYDADAVREQAEYGPSIARDGAPYGPFQTRASGGGFINGSRAPGNGGTRNLRNVWTIATSPFSGWTDSVALVPVPASEALERAALGNAGESDMARITLPDCPLHAEQPDWVPKGFCDGLSAAQLSRMHGSDDHRALELRRGSSTTQRTPERFQDGQASLDCLAPSGSETATLNSTESHRTGLDHLFSEHAISCEETADGRPRTRPSQCSPASIDHGIGESRSEAGSSASSCELGMAADSSRTSASESSGACRCRYYRKVVTKTSHFATFPPELVERCIKAGTSERGCCPECGAQWRRTTERVDTGRLQKMADGWDTGAGGHGTVHRDGREKGAAGVPVLAVTTTGWAPSCTCNAGAPVPATVLDPFAGAGTTCLVADRLQRDAIGIELNPDYVTMGSNRIVDDAPLFSSWPPAEDPAEQRMRAEAQQRDLFASC